MEEEGLVIYPKEIRWDTNYMTIKCVGDMVYSVLEKSQAYTYFSTRKEGGPAKVWFKTIANKKYITKAENAE